MFSCVKVVTPDGGTGVGAVSTITGVNDSVTGAQFSVRHIINLGGYAFLNTLMYQGTQDSAYHWDWGLYTDATFGNAAGGGICHDFGIKVASGASGGGYSFMDTWPDIFFGGYIGGFGYVHDVIPGQFKVTWDRRDRNGDAKLLLLLGDTDYETSVQIGINNGAHATAANPRALLNIQSGPFGGASAPGTAATGAGGTGYELGWAAEDGNQSTHANSSGNQNGNSRSHLGTQFSATAGASISAWGASSITVSSSGAAGSTVMILSGANIRAKAGKFAARGTDGTYTFSVGLYPRAILFSTVGLPVGTASDTEASQTVGVVDVALSQGNYWTGDITNGVTVPSLLGARYLSDQEVLKTGHANGGSTTFANYMRVTAIDTAGNVTVEFTGTDGVLPMIYWLAVGTVAVPLAPILKSDHGGLDNDLVYQAYVKTRAILPAGDIGELSHLREGYLTAEPTDATIQLTLCEDFDLRATTDSVVVTGAGGLVTKKFEQIQDADLQVVQYKLGDGQATEDLWALHQFANIRKQDGEA